MPHELSCTVSAQDVQKNMADVTVSARVPTKTHVVVTSENGAIQTRHLSGTQSLTAGYGNVRVHLNDFGVEISVFVHNARRSVTLEAPKKAQAQLAASTLAENVFAELPVTVQPHTALLNKEYWGRVKKEVNGLLGDGGAPITLKAENGDIKILVRHQ